MYVQSVQSITSKLIQSLSNGTPPDIKKDMQSASTEAMMVFQKLVQERLNFNELLAGKDPAQNSILKERCDFLEKEKLGLLVENEDLRNQMSDLKLQSGQTLHLTNEIQNLKNKLDIFALRFEKLSKYDKDSVEDLLNKQEDAIDYSCICGGAQLAYSLNFIEKKKTEFENFKPQPTQKQNESQHQANGTKKETMLENMLNTSQQRIQDLMMEVDKLKLDRAFLEGKFLKSGIMEDLSKQLLDVINHSMHLKQQLDTAQNALESIQKKRVVELKEIYEKNNQEKLKLHSQIASLTKDLNIAKERNLEFLKHQDSSKLVEASREGSRFQSDSQKIEELTGQIIRMQESLVKETEASRGNHNRAYKYEKELLTIKDTFYAQLLNQYHECESLKYRHSRHESIFKKLFALTAEKQLDVKADLEELAVYVKTREDKIGKLESDWKKASSQLNDEKKQNEAYLKELVTTTKAYDEISKEIKQLKEENAELNSKFNRVYKEKTTEKQAFDLEVQKLAGEIKRYKDQIPALKQLVHELKGSLSDQERFVQKAQESYTVQKNILDQVIEEKNKLAVELENARKESASGETKAKHLEEMGKQKTKELSEARRLVQERDNLIQQNLKLANMDIDIDMKNVTQVDILAMRADNTRLNQIVVCSSCKKREKDSIIKTCFHRFCGECLSHCLEHRERKCPYCGIKFAHQDVKKLYEEA